MKKRHQPAISIPEQIENLKRLGLEIPNEKRAAELLNRISYYRLVKGYSLWLKPKNEQYLPGTSFNQLVSLYNFNSAFRHLLFHEIEKIEVSLRCCIANHFSEQYGVLGYKNASNFRDIEFRDRFLEGMEKEIARNCRAPFVKNFVENYQDGDLPLYALVEIMSFGTLSKLFKNMKNCDKRVISRIYGVDFIYLESWIESLAYVRNICAHYGRLYHTKLTKSPKLYPDDRKKGVGNGQIFGVVFIMRYLLPDKDWGDLVIRLDTLLSRATKGYVKLDAIGFPKGWQKLLLS